MKRGNFTVWISELFQQFSSDCHDITVNYWTIAVGNRTIWSGEGKSRTPLLSGHVTQITCLNKIKRLYFEWSRCLRSKKWALPFSPIWNALRVIPSKCLADIARLQNLSWSQRSPLHKFKFKSFNPFNLARRILMWSLQCFSLVKGDNDLSQCFWCLVQLVMETQSTMTACEVRSQAWKS